LAKKSKYLNESKRNENPFKENTLCASGDVQICIMKKKVDEFLNLHSKKIVGEAVLSHQKAHL